MIGGNFFSVSKTTRIVNDLILLLLLLWTPRHSAFCTMSPSRSMLHRNVQWDSLVHTKLEKTSSVLATKAITSSRITKKKNVVVGFALFMAAPGKSDEIVKQEREAEIRSKIAKLKSQGKFKNKDGTQSAEDAAMLEAEAFFNKPSPIRKFEKMAAERERIKEAEAKEQQKQNDDGSAEKK